uniref:Glycoside hydrolase family 5 domain-containing protein n=1 Tax=Alexandrium monilatum TaxID=311494 RepID=A0A7S4W0C7_9DINO
MSLGAPGLRPCIVAPLVPCPAMVLLRTGAAPAALALPRRPPAARHDGLAEPWVGVNLGGWLLLEPGPATPLFAEHPEPESGVEVRCEWALMEVLRATKGEDGAQEVIRQHRDTLITKTDFKRIRSCGLNAVRLPFGYWVVLGPSEGEPYVGPAMEYLDRAVDWAEECGLQLVLDLHGCPGGESGEAPCGRRQRPRGTWNSRDWRFGQSLEVLQVVATRYQSRHCVTGIEVCNEPSNTVPLPRLCRYYDTAVDRIRAAGMPASRVAVLLPLFQRPEAEVAAKWRQLTGDRHENVCFDVHCYHCFENEFHGKTFAQHLRAIRENAEMLRKYPMVVGEWSLALGHAAWATCGCMREEEVYKLFGMMQLEAFQEASHGFFFWNWTEGDDVEWNFQHAFQRGLLSGRPTSLPHWDGLGEDPLEEQLHPSPPEPRVFFGESVYLRVFHGKYIDVYGSTVSARWADKGGWQELTFCPPAGSAARPRALQLHRAVRDGDVVRLRTHNGRYLAVVDGAVSAVRAAAGPCTEFVVRVKEAVTLRHRGIIFLQSRANNGVVDAHEEEEGLFTRWQDFGAWQQLAVEKAPHVGSPPAGVAAEAVLQEGHRMLEEAEAAQASEPAEEKEAAPAPAAGSPRKRRRIIGKMSGAELAVAAAC